jgi:DNA-binding transcriptional MocR family regulator
MPSPLAHSIGAGAGAATIAAAVEAAVARGDLRPGDRLPPIRDLATDLRISAATVASAYRDLRTRGIVTGEGRRGTVVAGQPPLRVRPARRLPPGVRDLASGNPDPALLPDLGAALARIDAGHKLYGGPPNLERLVEQATAGYAADGIGGDIAVVSGALDGIERALLAQLRSGDRVAVEDPCWPRIQDLVRALGLRPQPVAVDGAGIDPDGLADALGAGARAVIATPRGQNPTGAAVDAERAARLRAVLADHPHVLAVEDDYLAGLAGAGYHPLHDGAGRWVVIRSVSKVFGPDLRVATVVGDPVTINRIQGRQLVGPGWVSHLLQQTVAELVSAAAETGLLAHAERTYADRRDALADALAERGIAADAGSGLGIWVPVDEETAVVQALLRQGWGVSPGERYRLRAGPGIRITTASLDVADAPALADAVAAAVTGDIATYLG